MTFCVATKQHSSDAINHGRQSIQRLEGGSRLSAEQVVYLLWRKTPRLLLDFTLITRLIIPA